MLKVTFTWVPLGGLNALTARYPFIILRSPVLRGAPLLTAEGWSLKKAIVMGVAVPFLSIIVCAMGPSMLVLLPAPAGPAVTPVLLTLFQFAPA